MMIYQMGGMFCLVAAAKPSGMARSFSFRSTMFPLLDPITAFLSGLASTTCIVTITRRFILNLCYVYDDTPTRLLTLCLGGS